MIRTHPVTGRRCVYVVAGECEGITGIADDEAAELLEMLAAHCVKPEFQYRHRWQQGDVLILCGSGLRAAAAPVALPDDGQGRGAVLTALARPQADIRVSSTAVRTQ